MYVSTRSAIWKVDKTCAKVIVAGDPDIDGNNPTTMNTDVPALSARFSSIFDFAVVGTAIYFGDYGAVYLRKLDLVAGTVRNIAGQGGTEGCGTGSFACSGSTFSGSSFYLGNANGYITYSASANRLFVNWDRWGGGNAIAASTLDGTGSTLFSAWPEEAGIAADPDSSQVFFCDRDGMHVYRFDAATGAVLRDSSNNPIPFTQTPAGSCCATQCQGIQIISDPISGFWRLLVNLNPPKIVAYDKVSGHRLRASGSRITCTFFRRLI
eukprot:tig00000828_g4615.t1